MASAAQQHKEMEVLFQSLLSTNENLTKASHTLDQLTADKVFSHPTACNQDELERYKRFQDRDVGGAEGFPGRGLPLRRLNHLIAEAKVVCQSLEKTQETLRSSLNTLSRPYLRKLFILDLPDELLLKIFQGVEGFAKDHPDPSVRLAGRAAGTVEDIKRCRLVCRRFYATSSEFLMRSVVVAFNEESLERFEQTCRHSLISKGIVDVQVALEIHDNRLFLFGDFLAQLKSRLTTLLPYCEDLPLVQGLRRLRIDRATSTIPERALQVDRATSTIPEHAAHVRALVADVVFFIRMIREIETRNRDDDLDRDDRESLARLHRIHKEYMKHVRIESILIWSGRFARLFAESMARIRTRRLTLTDNLQSLKGEACLFRPGVPIWDIVEQYVIRSMALGRLSHSDLRRTVRGKQRPGILPLLRALQDRRVFLTELNVHLERPVGRDLIPVLNQETTAQISTGMSRLKGFSIICPNEKFFGRTEIALVMERFSRACLSSPSLERIEISMREMRTGNEVSRGPGMNLARIMDNSVTRERLRSIYLKGVAADSHTLSCVIQNLPPSMRDLNIQNMYLRNGSWKDVLDELRETDCENKVLVHPSGRECSTLPRDDYQRIFGTRDWASEESESSSNDAGVYINTKGFAYSRNPLARLKADNKM